MFENSLITTNSYSDFFAIGNVRYMLMSTMLLNDDIPAKVPKLFGQLKSSDFPVKNVNVPCIIVKNTGEVFSYGRLQIKADGSVYVSSDMAVTHNQFFFNATAIYRVK